MTSGGRLCTHREGQVKIGSDGSAAPAAVVSQSRACVELDRSGVEGQAAGALSSPEVPAWSVRAMVAHHLAARPVCQALAIGGAMLLLIVAARSLRAQADDIGYG